MFTENSPESTTQVHVQCSQIESLEAFVAFTEKQVQEAPGVLDEQGFVVQGLDLCAFEDGLLSRGWERFTFLGCRFSEASSMHISASGGTIFPPFDGIPYNPYRGCLYTSAELAENDLDTRIYEHQAEHRRKKRKPILESLAQRIHDHAVDDALEAYLRRFDRVVAIMGGHSLQRDEQTYRSVALVARSLTRAGYHVVTGGGPGAMEAGNLGAWLAPHPDEAIDTAIAALAAATDYSTEAYAVAAQEVVAAFPHGAESLAIPTWFYGHEPTNQFATAVAKYFSNSIREDGLLAIATHGVVYTPGAAGTVQEVFMDATQNHYQTFEVISPMVFVDSEFWADDGLSAPRLLRQLAGDRPYGEMIAVLDDPDDVVSFIESNPPRS